MGLDVSPCGSFVCCKTAVAYVVLLLSCSSLSRLLVWALCARTNEPGSGDTHIANDQLTMQIKENDTNTMPTNPTSTIIKCKCLSIKYNNIFTPTTPSQISLFGLPLARTILPHSLALPPHNPVLFLPGLFDYLSPQPSGIPHPTIQGPNSPSDATHYNKISVQGSRHYI